MLRLPNIKFLIFLVAGNFRNTSTGRDRWVYCTEKGLRIIVLERYVTLIELIECGSALFLSLAHRQFLDDLFLELQLNPSILMCSWVG
jgi:hypothetical protein